MTQIKQVKLGSQGLVVPAVGLGCMGMSKWAGEYDIYGKSADENESIATIHRSLELGGNFLDTADVYGPLANERLIAKAIKGNREKYLIATKFGFEVDDNEQLTGKINGSSEYVRKAVERSLKNLGTDYIDLYYLHRLDTGTPIEETVGAMADMVKEGKIRHIGLSEVGSQTIQIAHAIHPLTAVQSEFSLFERNIEEIGIIDTLNELGVGLVAYSPIGRGFLSGEILKPEDLPENDSRRGMPRYQGERFFKNIELVKEIKIMAEEKSITTAQLAIAWVIAKGHVPIPGTRKVKNLEANIASAEIVLGSEDLDRLESIVPLGSDVGARYDEAGMKMVNL
ncbi:aldo/keto reductase [Flavobacterium akiainvivens]|uniref:Aldo/keto reductase n=1 Tax=Flavobacterium akiainvivens TaxID=1202724 RepID=A0A0M9VH96_9FLAO|nr:aldo/keto reductase [Flavobacterium akiainvivens]KOS05296.1 aldo/keto reductase [Flavobacterium akiainvivens]SFQ76219.1 Predicted oxidoreductase [Flavobacterium akiainvivens]